MEGSFPLDATLGKNMIGHFGNLICCHNSLLKGETMSILAGYFSKSGKLDTAETIEKAKSYSIMKDDNLAEYDNSNYKINFGHIIQKYKTGYPIQYKPCEDENGNFLAVLGYLKNYGLDENLNKLLGACKQDISYLANKLEGEFVLIYNEGRTGKVHIINDRFGSRPFYICNSGNIVYFSSNLAFLNYLSNSKYSNDILGCIQLFAYGRTVDQRTIFKDVKRLSAATHLTISKKSIEENRYWRLKCKPEVKIEPHDYSNKVYSVFREGAAFRANLSQKGVVALSGGLDSRLVIGAIPSEALFEAFTFIDSTDNIQTIEVKTAREVSRALGRKHHVELIPAQFIFDNAEDIVKLTGGLGLMNDSAKTLSIINKIRAKGFDYLLGGGPGDVISGDVIPSQKYLDPSKTKECISDFLYHKSLGGKMIKTYLSLVFNENIINEYYSKLQTSLMDTLEFESGPTAAHMITEWYVNTGMPSTNFISPIHNHPGFTETFCHIDYEFCDLMCQLPASLHYKRNFYNYMIYHCLPELRAVAYANTGQLLTGELVDYDSSFTLKQTKSIKSNIYSLLKKSEALRYLVAQARKVQKIKVSKQKIDPLLRKDEALFHYFLLQEDHAMFEDLLEILHAYTELSHILDIAKCVKFLDRYRNSVQQTKSYHFDVALLGALASLCYSFKYLR